MMLTSSFGGGNQGAVGFVLHVYAPLLSRSTLVS
jgi:hypothetical protein